MSDEKKIVAPGSTGAVVKRDENIGDLIDEKCPECKSELLGNKVGVKWCSFVECTWSNEKSLTDFMKGLSA